MGIVGQRGENCSDMGTRPVVFLYIVYICTQSCKPNRRCLCAGVSELEYISCSFWPLSMVLCGNEVVVLAMIFMWVLQVRASPAYV